MNDLEVRLTIGGKRKTLVFTEDAIEDNVKKIHEIVNEKIDEMLRKTKE